MAERKGKMKSIIPEDFEKLGIEGMSNCDGVVDKGIGKKLKSGKYVAQHSAWNFCGYFWWDKKSKEFIEEVWNYGSPIKIFKGKTPKDLMGQVNAEFGNE